MVPGRPTQITRRHGPFELKILIFPNGPRLLAVLRSHQYGQLIEQGENAVAQ
jgi:hypothetical protein